MGRGPPRLPRKSMKNVSAAALVALAAILAATAATADGAHSRRSAFGTCSYTPALKTLADRDKNRVNLNAIQTDISHLGGLAAPRTPPKRRRTSFQRHAWRVVAQITEFRTGPDGEIQLVLFDKKDYMLAGIPTRTCKGARPSAARLIAEVRRHFLTGCGRPDSSQKPLGAVAYVSGVGYWGPRSGGGVAGTGAQLNPVTELLPVAGCGA
jgi:hypothetical protein